MDYLLAVILGMVQGLTEFFPVSSSGHLVILERLIGFQIPVVTFHVFLHMGSALVVLSVMHRDFSGIFSELKQMAGGLKGGASAMIGKEKTFPGRGVLRTDQRRLIYLILYAMIPSVIAGTAFAGAADYMSVSPFLTGAGFMITGILLLVTEMVNSSDETIRDMHPSWAVLTGLVQGIAVLPGISRAAATLSMGIFCGLSRKSALRFSYMIFVPVTFAAFIRCLAEGIGSGVFTGRVVLICLIGMAASAASGALVMNRFLSIVRKGRLSSFAYYCFTAGLIAITIGLAL